MLLQIYWTILLIFSSLFLIYYNINTTLVLPTPAALGEVMKSEVKKIVAYSLGKQIENEGVEYLCEQRLEGEHVREISESDTKPLWTKIDGTNFFVSTVNFDKRLKPYNYLRVVSVIKGSENKTIFCQIKTSDGRTRVIKSTVMPIWYREWDVNDNTKYFNPTLISCRLPILPKTVKPTAVDLTTTPCKRNNLFFKIFKTPKKIARHFTVCVKPLNFKEDVSHHLVQWIEICRTLGAEHFHIFIGNVTDKTRGVLKWYNSTFPNMFTLENFRPVQDDSSDDHPNNLLHQTWQRRRYEVISYNSCFYKNLNSKYVIPLDIDEIIVPKTSENWEELTKQIGNAASLIVQNVYFFKHYKPDASEVFFFQGNKRTRTASKKGENSKSFISTRNALTVFNHYALSVLRPGVIKYHFLPFKDVQLNHYKAYCNSVIFPECLSYISSPRIADHVIFRYRDKFNEHYGYILKKIRKDKIIL